MSSLAGMPGQGLSEHGLPRASSSARKSQKLSWRQHQRARIAAGAEAIWKVIKPYPSTVIWPLVVLAALLLAGVWGVTLVAQASAESSKDRVEALATDVASWYRQRIVSAYMPIISLALVIHHDPSFQHVARLFNVTAPELMTLVGGDEPEEHGPVPQTLTSLQLAPNGVIRMAYPTFGNDSVLGTNVFDDDLAGSITTIQNDRLTMLGPLAFQHGGLGVRAQLPVFVRGVAPNASFDAPDNVSALCGSYCYNATSQSLFWGFATALIELDILHNGDNSRLRELASAGYHYELLAPRWEPRSGYADKSNMTVLARSDSAPKDPVVVVVDLIGNEWLLRVAPKGGWTPFWYAPVMAAVVVVVVAISALFFAVLVSRRQHQTLLEALLPREIIDHLKHENAGTRMGPRIMESATTADILLNLLGDLLEGITPDLRDIVLIRQQILQNMDIYQPLNFTSQLRDANLDDDVTKALMHQLGGKYSFSVSAPNSDVDDDSGGELRSGNTLVKSVTMGGHDYATLSGALAMILAPQGGWYDSGPDLSDAASDAALPTHDTEAAISPRPSNNSMFGRAASQMVMQNSWRLGSPEHLPQAGASPLGPQGSCSGPQGGGAAGAGAGAAVGGSGGSVLFNTAGSGIAVAGSTGGVVTSTAGAVSEGAPGVLPGASPARALHPEANDRLVMTSSSAISASCVRMTEDGGTGGHGGPGGPTGAVATVAAITAGPVVTPNGTRRPPKKGDSHTSLLNFARGVRRKSALLTVSIADGPDGNGGGGGGHSKTLSNGSHPDTAGNGNGNGKDKDKDHADHHLNAGRLWAATVSRRSITGMGQVIGQLMAKKPPTPSAPVIEEVERVLAKADSWQFDMWRLRDVTNGHPLSALGFYLIQRAGLITSLKLKAGVLARLLRHIEAGYNENPYHNATHAADVLQTLHVIIHGGWMHVHYLDHLGLLAAYFAAIVHDYGHPGLTNDFLIATSDPLAVRYNDKSPLENHHSAAAFSSMRRAGLDVLAPLTTEQKSTFRKQVIEMVLATDMKQHFSLLSHFITVHRLSNYTNKALGTPGAGTPLDGQGSNMELQYVSVQPPSLTDMAPKPVDETERLLSLQIAIKAADLGHLGEGMEVHKRWLSGLEEEFFRQGDKERQLGIPISPLFDRSKQGVSKSQVGFYDFVALPLVHALSSAFPGTQPLMTCFLANSNIYRSMDPQASPAEPRSGKLITVQPPARPATGGTAAVPQVNSA